MNSLRLEGLAKIIVRPAVQSIDHVFLGVLGGQHDESGPFPQLAQRHDDIESVAVRQHPVDDGQIVLEIAKRLPGIRKGSDDVDNPAELPEQTAEIGANLRLVFDHQGAHRSSLECVVDGSSKIACFPLAALDAPREPKCFPLWKSRQASEDRPSSGSRNGEELLGPSNLGAMLVGDPVTRNNTVGR
jgi:hypothetical protein